MIETLDPSHGNLLGVRLGGALTGDDYRALRAALQRAGRDGPVHLLVLADDHHGPAEPGAAWADPVDAPARPVAVGRLALVGDGEWHTWTAWLDRLLAPDAVRSFSEVLLAEAWVWVRDGDAPPSRPPKP